MISSSKEKPSTRDSLEDQFLNFNCYKFSRGIKAERPLSRRTVSAEECLCTRDTTDNKICDRNRLYSLHFRETTAEEVSEIMNGIPDPDIPVDRIGVFRPNDPLNFINVPPEFLNVLWNAAIAADGVLRSIQLTVQPQKGEAWAVFEAYLKEEIAQPFELPVDKDSNPKVGPPRNNPVVTELREQLRLRWSRVGPGIITIAIGVLLALWIAKLWR